MKIRAEDASTQPIDGWLQMEEWLAELREHGRTEPPWDTAPGGTGPDSTERALAQAQARPWAQGQALARIPAQTRAEPHATAGSTVRALIGDQLRIPIMWCEMGSCDSYYTDPAALGEADIRVRAIDAGWRVDGLGRLACPGCQQALAQAKAQARALARIPAQTRAEPRGYARATCRALIGDQLRLPLIWCEMASCITWYTDPAALGEADIRVRVLAAGWQIDGLGRLACPDCQQTNPDFRTIAPVVRWDRHTAIVHAAWAAGVSQQG